MKKIRLALIATLAIMTFAIFGASQNQTVSAKAKYVTTFPKSMRGTWYAYTKKYGLSRIVITKDGFEELNHGEKYNKHLIFKLRKPLTDKQSAYVSDYGNSAKRFKKYTAAIDSVHGHYIKKDGHKWLYLLQRLYQSGQHMGMINVSKVNGHPVLSYIQRVLAEHDPFLGPLHFTKNKKLAKQIQGKKFKGFKYHKDFNSSKGYYFTNEVF
ncbi:hypothetical protein RZ56_00800 [Apilactobacillus kunkeei]|nr:hypothetical protein RZ56_00800 [Apilactobacillus kunkeei]